MEYDITKNRDQYGVHLESSDMVKMHLIKNCVVTILEKVIFCLMRIDN